jgi:hypothetical protein
MGGAFRPLASLGVTTARQVGRFPPMPTAKDPFLAAHDCPTLGWRMQHAQQTTPPPGLHWRFWQGQQVHRLGREWLGEGGYLRRTPRQTAAEATAEAVADPSSTLLFEATFEAHDCIARADAIRRLGQGWELLEIKSGSGGDDRKVKAEYLNDVGFTTAVLKAAGLPIHRVTMVLVNGDYIEGNGDSLFVEVDVTADALERAAEFGDHLPEVAAILAGPEPTPSLCFACKGCDHFGVDCVGMGITDPLFDIPRLSRVRFEEFKPYARVANLPPDAKLTTTQAAHVAVMQSGVPSVDRAGLALLDQIRHPVRYLDFEAVAPAVPRFAGTSPHQVHPFQFSLHVRHHDGTEEHHAYLAAIDHDWRRDLAERLLDLLGDEGSIVVYSGYERTALRQLAAWFPDLDARIAAVIERLHDLEKVVKAGYIHPGFRGRSSIKKVLPVMAPDCSYDGLEVSGGDDASGVFGFMWIGEYPPEDHEKHRIALLEYCKLDTLAMIRVHEGLEAVRRNA